MGFLAGLIHDDEEKNSKHNKGESNESLQRELEEQAENWNRISAYEEEKRWEEANLREEEYYEKLKTSEENYLKVKKLYVLIKLPDSEIEKKVQAGELTLTVIDKIKFHLSKIDRSALRKSYGNNEKNWSIIQDNIDYWEELAFVKGNLISRCMRK